MINAYAAMEAGGKLQAWQYEPAPLGPDEVEIEVDYCGICHSDVSMLDNEWGMSAYPLVAGHEVVGRISALGQDVTHLQPGQIVGLGWHSGYCQTCSSCGSRACKPTPLSKTDDLQQKLGNTTRLRLSPQLCIC